MRLSDVKEHSTPVFEERSTSSVPSPMPHHRIVSRGVGQSPSGARVVPLTMSRVRCGAGPPPTVHEPRHSDAGSRGPLHVHRSRCAISNMTLRRRGGGSPVAPELGQGPPPSLRVGGVGGVRGIDDE